MVTRTETAVVGGDVDGGSDTDVTASREPGDEADAEYPSGWPRGDVDRPVGASRSTPSAGTVRRDACREREL